MNTLAKQRALLRKEYEYEKLEFQRATETMGVDRKVKRGECWFPITVGRSRYNSLDRLTVEILRQTDKDIAHNFEYGRCVCFFTQTAEGSLRYLDFTAIVSYAEAGRMVITLPDEQALVKLRSLEAGGVQLHFDETTYRLMFEALDHVMAARDNRLATLRDIVHGQAPLHLTPLPGHVALPWLNRSQEQAVNDVLGARDFLIVHGPPGTGKTTTLVEAVSEVLRREPQVLVCAQSNTAVDWISEQLADRGISVLRIGNPTRVTDKMLSFTYERRFEAHPDYATLWQIRRTVRQLLSAPRKGRGEAFHQKINRLRERADELEVRIRHALFDEARVVACTLAGSANKLLVGRHYHTLFIDEAAQALEAACWIAAAKADRIILAGDHCQLPPTVKCPEALSGGLGTTLMETLAKRRPECVRLLTVQYRMNEVLMHFPSEWFYEGRLVADVSVRHRSLLDLIDDPLVWVDTTDAPITDNGGYYREEFVGYNYGRVNKAEAALTLRTLEAYVGRIGRNRLLEERADFGIISPYCAQVQYLLRLVSRSATLKPLLGAITVNTVDAFQGQERDVILVSLVRANDKGEIGFLRDLRRMNVAITRARMKLIILGSVQTLCRHPFYRKLFDACHHEKPESILQLPDNSQ